MSGPSVTSIVEEVHALAGEPGFVDRAIQQYIITEIVTRLLAQGQLGAAGESQLAITTAAAGGSESTTDDGTTTICTHHGISAFGYEVVGWDSCVITTATGTASISTTLAP